MASVNIDEHMLSRSLQPSPPGIHVLGPQHSNALLRTPAKQCLVGSAANLNERLNTNKSMTPLLLVASLPLKSLGPLGAKNQMHVHDLHKLLQGLAVALVIDGLQLGLFITGPCPVVHVAQALADHWGAEHGLVDCEGAV